MPAKYITQTFLIEYYNGSESGNSPDMDEGDLGVAVVIGHDGRQAISTPTWGGTVMTGSHTVQAGGGGYAWGGTAGIWHIPITAALAGVKTVASSVGCPWCGWFIRVTGVNLQSPLAYHTGAYGLGNTDKYIDLTNVEITDITFGGALCGVDPPDGYKHTSGEQDYYASSDHGQRRMLARTDDGEGIATVRYWWDWAGSLNSVLVGAVFNGLIPGGNQVIWTV